MSLRTHIALHIAGLAIIALAFLAALTGERAPTPTTITTVAHTEPHTPTPTPAAGAPDWRAVAAAAGPAVVVVRAGTDGQGSGALIGPGGVIATAAHVVRREDGSVPDDLYVDFADGTSADATLLGRSDAHDLALLRVDDAPEGIAPLAISERTVVLGEPVAAMGAPFARAGSISTGIVSGLGRSVESLQRSFQMNGAIQTDAAVNRGNSGGPLLDARGHLIGIVVQIESQTGVSSGVGFAVPAATLAALAPTLAGGDHHAAYLGVTTSDLTEQIAEQIGMRPGGALIQAVADAGPAANAGLRSGTGRLTNHGRQLTFGAGAIIAVGDDPIRDSADLAERISLRSPGERITLTVRHEDNRHSTHTITLAERPTGPASAAPAQADPPRP